MTTAIKPGSGKALPSAKQALHEGIKALRGHSNAPESDALWLMTAIEPAIQTQRYSDPDRPLSTTSYDRWSTYLARRLKGEPVAYILGHTAFWSLSLRVTPAVLIPRRETEHVVTAILDGLDAAPKAVLELGTGSGAITAALASERPGWQFTALDKDPDALAIAEENFKSLGFSVRCLSSDWFSALPKVACFDVVVCNPPYLAEEDPHLAQGDLRFEPRHALVSGETGLVDLHHVIAQSRHHLKPGGGLFLEHGNTQAKPVQQWLAGYGYRAVQTIQDYSGHDRVTLGRRPTQG